MSKQIKQMEMNALRKSFQEVRDLVLLSASGVDAVAENQMRLGLRKKNIRLQLVKNSLAARVFKDIGIEGLDAHLQGPTTLAWGSLGIAELSKEIDKWLKGDKIRPKAAVADGTVISFEAAKKFPTKAEAQSWVITLALAPASRVAGQLVGPASRLAGQIKSIADKAPAEPETAPAPA